MGPKDLLRQLYAALDGLLHDPLVVHHVARRQAWLNFFEAPAEADREFARLLAEARRLNFVQEEADALDDLAQTCRRGNADLDRRGEAEALGGLGSIMAFFEPEDAIDNLQVAIAIQRELGNSSSYDYDLSMLATAYETLDEALQIARAGGTLRGAESGLWHTGAGVCRNGRIDRVKTCVQEASAATRESAGTPITGGLVFVIRWAAIYLTVANDAPSGIELMEQTIQDAAVVQPQLVPMGNLVLDSVLLLSGDLARARQVLPPEPHRMAAIMGVGYTYWIGVLLIKTGEHDQATTFFDSVLKLSRHAELSTDNVHYSHIGTLPARSTRVGRPRAAQA